MLSLAMRMVNRGKGSEHLTSATEDAFKMLFAVDQCSLRVADGVWCPRRVAVEMHKMMQHDN